MAMTKGTVTIDQNDGSVSGGGMARALFDGYWPKVEATLPAGYDTATEVSAKNAVADLANGFAEIVGYLKSNAKADDTDAGQQWDIL